MAATTSGPPASPGWPVARAEVGEISPHLLDRFALRLSVPIPRLTDHASAAQVHAWATRNDPYDRPVPVPPLPRADRQRLGRAAALSPATPPEVLGKVLALIPTSSPGARRALALARLSRALARQDFRKVVDQDDVRRAAELIELSPEGVGAGSPWPTLPGGDEGVGDTATGSTTTEGLGTPVPSSLDLVTDPDAPAGTVAVYEPDTEAAFPAESLPPGPYPEDHAPVVREANSLRWPARRYRATADTEGPVLGTQPATSLADIALVSTVLEAAKYRKVRPPPAQGACPFRITRADLRSHRRAPWPDRILVLVVDSTCLGGRDWEAALLPFLRWAYVERARISLVQVGGPRAREPMRAEQVDGRNLLNPRLGRALDDLGLPGGTATPLAHGLDLAAPACAGLCNTAAPLHGRRGSWYSATAGATCPWLPAAPAISTAPSPARGSTTRCGSPAWSGR